MKGRMFKLFLELSENVYTLYRHYIGIRNPEYTPEPFVRTASYKNTTSIIWMLGDMAKKKSVFTAGVVVILVAAVFLPVVGTTGGGRESPSLPATEFVRSNHDGTTLYVGGSGSNNYTKIQDAIDNASDGDTVFVYSGVYNESILVDKRIDLVGGERNTTIIQAAAGYTLNITADGVHISAFTIRNGSYPYAAVILHKVADVSVSKCNFCGNDWRALFFSNSDNNTISRCRFTENEYAMGIELRSSNDNIISNCIISNNQGGIYLVQSDENIISNCNIYYNLWGGISLESSSHDTISGNAFVNDSIWIGGQTPAHFIHNIVNNTVNGLPLWYLKEKKGVIMEDMKIVGGVILVNCSDMVLRNLTISKGGAGITAAYCRNITIRDCTIYDNGEGISLYFSNNNIFVDCDIYNNIDQGVTVTSSDGNIFSKCNIYYNKVGIDIMGSKNVVSACDISDNDMGVYVTGFFNKITRCNIENSSGWGIMLLVGSGNVITHNNFRGNRINAFFTNAAGNVWLRNYWRGWIVPFPKPIFGFLVWAWREAAIPWLNFDWSPRFLPYGWWTYFLQS